MIIESPPQKGQGALEYLLLIGGGVLVAAVVLLLAITTVPAGGGVLNQSLSSYANLSTGNFSGGPICGDTFCNGAEDCSTCPSDCGVCQNLPVITIAVLDGQANENTSLSDNGKLTIARSIITSFPLDVYIDPDLGTANYPADFQTTPVLTTISYVITIPANAGSVDIDIIPLDDIIIEGVENALITLEDSANYGPATYVLSSQPNQSSAYVQIIDDDVTPPETISLTVTDADADEETGDIGTFTITRSSAQLGVGLDVIIALTGAAMNGTDYTTISTPATIPAGQTTVSVNVNPINDSSNEGDESVDLTIQLDPQYIIQPGAGSGTVTIHDNDGGSSLPTVTLTATDPIATETGQTTGTFTITRSPVDASVLPVTINLTGTASNVSGTDYTTNGYPVTIPSNQASTTIVVTPVDDALVEGSETVIATIAANPLSYIVGTPTSGTITIQDNDFNPPSSDLCENYNSGNTNKPGAFPSYSSLLEQSWTWRRTLNPTTDIDVGLGLDSTSLVTSFNNAACGSTIAVHDLPLATELDGFKLNGKNCLSNPIHIYFVAPVTISGGSGGGDVINIDNVKGLVIDGMNNLKVTTSQGINPRAIIFIGHQLTSGPIYTSTVKVVLKNLEVDGDYHGAGQNGTKWGVFGEGNTDIAFCNLYVHDIWLEHSFYFHTIGGNFEVVKSRMNNVGRTCIQIRDDWQGTPSSNYIYADNTCSNACEGGALTADDTSGTWWIHGNTIAKVLQGFVSIDSTLGSHDHRDGHVYFYDNKINMGAMPIRKTWGDTCGQPTQVPGSQFQIRDGGASFYSQNNIFIHSGGSQNIYFREYVNPLSTTRFPNILVESKNNTYANTNFGTTPNPTTKPIARWDWQVVDQKYILNVGQWQNSLPSIYKPNAYDLLADGSTYIGDQTTINNLINQYFSGIP